jgi:hypothetical protein
MSDTPQMPEWHRLLHRVWTDAVGTPGYHKPAWGELENELTRLQTELQEAQASLNRIKSLERVDLLRAGPDDEGRSFALELSSELWPYIVNALAVWFVDKGGKNFVEFKAEYDKTQAEPDDRVASLRSNGLFPIGPFVITMQRIFGKTPNQMRVEAEERAQRAEGIVLAVRQETRAAVTAAVQSWAKNAQFGFVHSDGERLVKTITDRILNLASGLPSQP